MRFCLWDTKQWQQQERKKGETCLQLLKSKTMNEWKWIGHQHHSKSVYHVNTWQTVSHQHHVFLLCLQVLLDVSLVWPLVSQQSWFFPLRFKNSVKWLVRGLDILTQSLCNMLLWIPALFHLLPTVCLCSSLKSYKCLIFFFSLYVYSSLVNAVILFYISH